MSAIFVLLTVLAVSLGVNIVLAALWLRASRAARRRARRVRELDKLAVLTGAQVVAMRRKVEALMAAEVLARKFGGQILSVCDKVKSAYVAREGDINLVDWWHNAIREDAVYWADIVVRRPRRRRRKAEPVAPPPPEDVWEDEFF